MENKLDLSEELFVIDVGDPQHIPALEMEIETGEYSVLVFTNYENAQKYCYLKNPSLVANIKQLSIQRVGTHLIQAGLLRIASVIKRTKPHITAFVFDHPGTRGIAHYASIQNVIELGRLKKKEEDTSNELMKFLDGEEN